MGPYKIRQVNFDETYELLDNTGKPLPKVNERDLVIADAPREGTPEFGGNDLLPA